jgi:hydrogenase-4 component B
MIPMICLAMLAYLAGSVCAAFLNGDGARRAAAAGAAAGALLGLAPALRVLATGEMLGLVLPSSVPVLALVLRLDPLGAFFLALIGLITVPVVIYGAGYMKDAEGRRRDQRLAGTMLNLFLLSMSLVTMAGNMFTFLLSWEGMALASYFLVILESENPEALSAGRWYAGMAHAGFGLVLAALLLLGLPTLGADFEAMRAASASIPAGTRDAIFLLVLLGFGSKAGLVPLHVWLPKAHPAAPSHVSALMSGVMLTIGLYGLLRVGFDLLGGGPPWWGGVVLGLGAISALKGVLYALVENDLKRLLAHSSVENIGIVFMGVGLGLIFRGYGMTSLAAMALVAALYHALNHAAFKALLFLGAGAVQRATGTRDMEEMGGLIKRMPQTAALFLIGSAAIAGLPPLNGFASEWMIFQSLMSGARVPHPFFAAMMALAAGALALTGGLAAACFVKAFGIPFLALPRSHRAEKAREVGRAMRLGMALLAACCLLLGVLPSPATRFLAGSLRGIAGLDITEARFRFGWGMQGPGGLSRMSPPILALCLAIAIGALPVALRIIGASRALRRGDTWGCGRLAQTPRMEYTSRAFAEPLRRVFADFYRPTKDLTVDFHPESRYFVRSIEYRSRIRSWFEDYLYRPLFSLVRPLGGGGRLIQSGSVHLYITYILLALLAGLLLARWL